MKFEITVIFRAKNTVTLLPPSHDDQQVSLMNEATILAHVDTIRDARIDVSRPVRLTLLNSVGVGC